jgi:anthranilate/para-aminobenzoate synthase component I
VTKGPGRDVESISPEKPTTVKELTTLITAPIAANRSRSSSPTLSEEETLLALEETLLEEPAEDIICEQPE